MFLFICPDSHHHSEAGILFVRQASAYSDDWPQRGDQREGSVFFQKKLRVPYKMSEGERYIIAETQNPVKGRWHADQ